MLQTVINENVFAAYKHHIAQGLSDLGKDICHESKDFIAGKLEETFKTRLTEFAKEEMVIGESELPLVEKMAETAVAQVKSHCSLIQAAKKYSAALAEMEGKTGLLHEDVDCGVEAATREFERQIGIGAAKCESEWAKILKPHFSGKVSAEALNRGMNGIQASVEAELEGAHRAAQGCHKPNIFAGISEVMLGAKHIVTGKALENGRMGKTATGLFAASVAGAGHGVYRMAQTQIDDNTGKPYHDVKGGALEVGAAFAGLLAALKMVEKNVRGL